MNFNFDFNNPELLWLLLLLPLMAFLKGRTGKNGTLVFSSVAIAAAVSRKNRSRAGGVLLFLRLLTVALIILGLARPRLGRGYSEREQSGIDIVLAVDVSGSMSALDLSKSREELLTRLDAVKSVLDDFIKNRPNDRIGMIAFGANPFIVSPLTLNHDWLTQNIDRLEIGLIDGGRTAIGSAVAASVNRLRDLKDSKSRIIILLTDGENNSGKISPIAAAEAAAGFDTKIYTIAAGREGMVPYAPTDRTGRVMRDRSGRPIVGGTAPSQIDESTLKKISEITGGRFYRASDYRGLRSIYEQIDSLEKTPVKVRNFTEYEELFWYPVSAALALLFLERLLAHTRYRILP